MIESRSAHRIYELSHPLNASTVPAPVSEAFELVLNYPHAPFDPKTGLRGDTIVSGTDRVSLGTHTGTHVDARQHVRRGGAARAEDRNSTPQAVVARGVMLDLPRHFGERCVTRTLTAADVTACATQQGTELRAGDAVLLRTGKDDLYADASEFLRPPFGGPGVEAAQFLADLGAAIVGSDTMPFEGVPSAEPLEVHAILLADNGIQILEMLNLSSLAADDVHEFLFVLAPLRIEGATGSPVNPLAVTGIWSGLGARG
jgi:kynurenine formamidase